MADEQYRGVYKVVFKGTVTVDISNAATGSGTFGTGTASVPGVQVGDAVDVFPVGSTALTAGAPVFGDVSAANTVRLTVLNNSAGAVDYASRAYKIVVYRPAF